MPVRIYTSKLSPPAIISAGLGAPGDAVAVWCARGSVSVLTDHGGLRPLPGLTERLLKIEASLVPRPTQLEWVSVDITRQNFEFQRDLMHHFAWLRFSLNPHAALNLRKDNAFVRFQLSCLNANLELLTTAMAPAEPVANPPPIQPQSALAIGKRPATDYFTGLTALHRITAELVTPTPLLNVGYEPSPAGGIGNITAQGTHSDVVQNAPYDVRITAVDAVDNQAQNTIQVVF